MFDFPGRVNETHNQLYVTLHSCGKNNRFTLFTEIRKKILKIFSLVDVE